MRLSIRGPRDVGAGLIYTVLGGAMFWGALSYRLGTAGRMGPGYFPRVLAAILVVIGIVSLLRGLLVTGEGIKAIRWKPLFLVFISSSLFGVLLEPAGLIVALLVMTLVAAAASREFRFDWKASIALVVLIAFCAAAFVKGLGVPMPLLGRWLEPLTAILPWLG